MFICRLTHDVDMFICRLTHDVHMFICRLTHDVHMFICNMLHVWNVPLLPSFCYGLPSPWSETWWTCQHHSWATEDCLWLQERNNITIRRHQMKLLQQTKVVYIANRIYICSCRCQYAKCMKYHDLLYRRSGKFHGWDQLRKLNTRKIKLHSDDHWISLRASPHSTR